MRNGLWLLVAAALAPAIAVAADPIRSREQLNAVSWVQTAPEYRAMTRSVYRAAMARLPAVKRARSSASVEQLSGNEPFGRKRAAVVMDIDETVLDTSAYNATLVRDGKSYGEPGYRWADWTEARAANEVAGAADFIRAARREGFAVVFITNRACEPEAGYDANSVVKSCPQRDATLDNLESILGYRPADDELMLRHQRQEWSASDKTPRRAAVATTYRIAMLVGDNLEDFVHKRIYDEAVHAAHWGVDWFVLPNPMYGSWEDDKKAVEQKYAALKTWSRSSAALAESRSGGVTMVSWNLEWLADPERLASNFWAACAAAGWPSGTKIADDLPFCDVYRADGIESAAQYESRKLQPLRTSLESLAGRGMDILAVQEVQSAQALRSVLPAGFEVVCFTGRVDAQNIGYAARSEWVNDLSCREIRALSLEDDPSTRSVRRGLELTIAMDGHSLVALNVHLKARCPKGRLDRNDPDCRMLRRQAAPLEEWIEARSTARMPFMVIGDWNRDLEQEVENGFPARADGGDPSGPIVADKVRNFFPELNDGKPAASGLRLAAVDRSVAVNSGCHKDLDQWVVSELLLDLLDPSMSESDSLPAEMVAGKRGASDHCALLMTLGRPST